MNHSPQTFFTRRLAWAGLLVSGVIAGLAAPTSAQTPDLEPALVVVLRQDKSQSDKTPLDNSKQEKSKSDNSKSDNSKSEKANSPRSNDNRVVVAPIEGKRREEILKFVRENHPEMVRLIDSLKQKNPHQYQQALVSIEKSMERLAQLKEANQQNYDQLLDEWKLNSRIQLLSAQLIINDTPARRKQLEELFSKLQDRRIAQIVANRDRYAEKLKQMDDNIKQVRNGREKEIQRRMESVIAAADRAKAKRQQAELAKKESEKQKSDAVKPNSKEEPGKKKPQAPEKSKKAEKN